MSKKKNIDVNYPDEGEDVSGEYDDEIEERIAKRLRDAHNEPMKKKVVRI